MVQGEDAAGRLASLTRREIQRRSSVRVLRCYRWFWTLAPDGDASWSRCSKHVWHRGGCG
jgi:hypothetical protein